jgi:phage gpG-like protein
VEVHGIDELARALQAMSTRVEAVTPDAIVTAQALIAGEARAALSRYSHQRGTPTPAPPGGPPALISGRLRSSFDLAGPTFAGAGVWTSVMGPTVPYARVQELGGRAGHSELPARPYLRPSAEKLLHSGRIAAVFTRAWTQALAP